MSSKSFMVSQAITVHFTHPENEESKSKTLWKETRQNQTQATRDKTAPTETTWRYAYIPPQLDCAVVAFFQKQGLLTAWRVSPFLHSPYHLRAKTSDNFTSDRGRDLKNSKFSKTRGDTDLLLPCWGSGREEFSLYTCKQNTCTAGHRTGTG